MSLPLTELGEPCDRCLAYARSRLHWMSLTAIAWKGRSEAREECDNLRAVLADLLHPHSLMGINLNQPRSPRSVLLSALRRHGIDLKTLEGVDHGL